LTEPPAVTPVILPLSKVPLAPPVFWLLPVPEPTKDCIAQLTQFCACNHAHKVAGWDGKEHPDILHIPVMPLIITLAHGKAAIVLLIVVIELLIVVIELLIEQIALLIPCK